LHAARILLRFLKAQRCFWRLKHKDRSVGSHFRISFDPAKQAFFCMGDFCARLLPGRLGTRAGSEGSPNRV
jgi:hypothetical protein